MLPLLRTEGEVAAFEGDVTSLKLIGLEYFGGVSGIELLSDVWLGALELSLIGGGVYYEDYLECLGEFLTLGLREELLQSLGMA